MGEFYLLPIKSDHSYCQSNGQNFKCTFKCHLDSDYIYLHFRLDDPHQLIDLGNYSPRHQRVIGLWEKTCFEFFLRQQNSESYLEFNFSPQFSWNAFSFQSYRGPLHEWEAIKQCEIDILRELGRLQLMIRIRKNEINAFFKPNEGLLFSATAVLKNRDGSFHYMAIKHADQKPNFHHPDSFIPLSE